jgi:GntR family transcriptional regulator
VLPLTRDLVASLALTLPAVASVWLTRPSIAELRVVTVFCKDDLENLMDREWNDNQPIYRQLRDRVVAMILDGVLKEGDPLPSVRNVATEYRVNPLTVLKGYQQLVDEELVEKKRGLGMFVKSGARSLLLQGERQKFLTEEWPRIQATIQRLGLKAKELLNDNGTAPSSDTAPSKTGESNSEKEER